MARKLSFRTSEKLAAVITANANHSGRSISQEIEERLSASLNGEDWRGVRARLDSVLIAYEAREERLQGLIETVATVLDALVAGGHVPTPPRIVGRDIIDVRTRGFDS